MAGEVSQPDFAGALIVLIIVGAISYMVWLGISTVTPISTNTTCIITNTSIVSLNDGSLTSGSFFLGSGSLDQRTMYFYYEGSEDTYRLKRVPTDDATIKTDENDHPYITKIVATTCGTYRDGSSRCDKIYDWSHATYVFHVPKGTITKDNFNLDGRV